MTHGNQSLAEHLTFLIELGRALIAAGETVTSIHDTLLRVARAYKIATIRLMILPTVVLVELADDASAALSIRPAFGAGLRFNQIDALFKLVRRAEAGAVSPGEGVRQLQAILAMPPRFSRPVAVLGHTILVVGLALIIQPTQLSLLVALVTGTLIGVLKVLGQRQPWFDILLPVLSAFLVTFLVFFFISFAPYATPLRLLVPPLATFLPGALLTVATLELANRDIISGASRLVSGAVQVALLVFGIAAGFEVLDVTGANVLANVRLNDYGWWAPVAGVAVYGLGIYVHLSAPPKSLPWLLLSLYCAWAGQALGGLLLGAELGGFVGAVVVIPLATLAQRLGGPPAQVTILPAFWLLVPGAVALISATQLVNQAPASNLADLGAAAMSIVSIALGLLVGVALLSLTRGMGATRIEPSSERMG